MFWLGIAYFVWHVGLGPRHFAPAGLTPTDVALTAVYLHGWWPDTINSVVPGDWSIAAEMTFYLVFPLAMLLVRGWLTAIGFFLATNWLASASMNYFWSHRAAWWPQWSDDLVSNFLNFWFPNQLPVFAVGFVLFFAVRDCRGRLPPAARTALLLASIAAAVGLALVPTAANFLRVNNFTAWGLVFAVFAFTLADGAGTILVNRPIRHLGKISFSAYLLHFAVLELYPYLATDVLARLGLRYQPGGETFLLGALVVVVAITTVISTLTHHLVERPMITLGGRLAAALAARRRPDEAAAA